MVSRNGPFIAAAWLLAGLLSACGGVSSTPPPQGISGLVVDETGPVPDATVRIQATGIETRTDEQGRFLLDGLEPGVQYTVSAWRDGYYCALVDGVIPPAGSVTLHLRPYQTTDNPAYEWVPPTGADSCYSCKPGVTQVWLEHDAHAGAAVNPRFLTMYNGTDVLGNRSPLTRYGYSRDYGSFPLLPDPNQPYYGPGYKLDFPDTAGNCAACHTPGAAVNAPYGVDPNTVGGADAFGVHCDFCHKASAVTLDPATDLPYPNRPGVLSMEFRRPFPDDPERAQLFFGTFDDDNVPQEDTYLPLIEESRFCAGCHYGVFWDTLVYNSYGEWLESPYSDAQDGQTCQDCHMPAPTLLDGAPITNVAPQAGGVARDPMSIHAHTFPGAGSAALLREAVTLEVEAVRQGGVVAVTVTVTNDGTGHHVPTDSPLRHLILLVRAADAEGNPLEQAGGPVIPEWGGLGDPADGYYAGLPGTAYARILEEVWTETSPSGAYWNPTRVKSDNRIAALASDATRYEFRVSGPGLSSEVSIRVELLFRRAFIGLMDQKGWKVADILMESQTVRLP